MRSRRPALVAAVLVAAALATGWLFVPRSARGLAAAPAKPGPDRFGFAAAFDAELRATGQVGPQELAARHPAPAYLPRPSWDVTTAKFFDKLNVDKVVKPGQSVKSADGRTYQQPPTELPGYKLTADELAAYRRNGFVVSERLGGRSFGQVYYDVYSRDLPVFVTSDSVLHAWHRSYDAMLEELEQTYLAPALADLLAGMHAALPAADARYGRGPLRDAVRDADHFLAVARSLLAGGPVATALGQDRWLRGTLAAVAAEGMHDFDLFGRKRTVDFSQFKPRGRYEATPELQRYFRAMMWCGRTDLRVAGGYDGTGPPSSGRELAAAVVLLDLLTAAGKQEAWRQFDHLLQTFVGRADSATFDDLRRITAAAEIDSPAALATDADLSRLADTVLRSDAGAQDIRGDVYVSPTHAGRVELPRSFTVLGQRFVPDSWATAKVVYDDIRWDGEKVRRRVPSGLDVAFAVLGNSHLTPAVAERIEGGPHRFRDGLPYQHNLLAVRAVIDGLTPAAWDDTLYMGWLKALRTLSAPAGGQFPEALRTRAWAMKQANTQLASWAQLRHDTILYAKQSYTSVPGCYYPAGFVEPVVPFWATMEAMATRAADLLAGTPVPPAVKPTQAKQVGFFRGFAAQMGRLKAVAAKQLARQELTADERTVLEDVMQIGHQRAGSGSVPKYTGWYPALFYRGPEDCVKWDALVADVHTDVPTPDHGDPGCVLHQGVGGADLLVVAIDSGADRLVYAGPTLSHYEFELPGVARKTDKEWKTDLLDGKVPSRPDWTRAYLVPEADRKPADPAIRWRLLEQP